MAGYSGTPLMRKLGIKEGDRVLIDGAPEGYEETLGDLPPDVTVLQRATKDLDVVQLFCPDRKRLEQRLSRLKQAIFPDGMLWVSWPKKASGVETDLDGNVVRELGLDAGLVDVKVCAVDETWSGLKFVHRVEDRA